VRNANSNAKLHLQSRCPAMGEYEDEDEDLEALLEEAESR